MFSNRLFYKLLLIVFLCVSGPLHGAETRQQLDHFLADLTSFKASFQQRLTDEHGQLIEASAGQFYLQRPSRFRWEYSMPYAQSIIADGEKLWIYDRDLEQVTVNSLATALSNTPARLLSGDIHLDEEYRIEDRGELNGLNWLSLEPLEEEGQFSTIRLGFDKQGLKTMAVADNFGQVTRIDFFAIERNIEIDPDQFRFVPPEGVDVIDAAGE